MPLVSPSKPLTLIVAATTPSLGIGRGGGLPWPQLKHEMAYFARVTKRPPQPPPSAAPGEQAQTVKNAVIMGRRTWESIPARFRPLKGRVNVVVSRTLRRENVDGAAGGGVLGKGGERERGKDAEEDVIFVASFDDAVSAVSSSQEWRSGHEQGEEGAKGRQQQVGHVFVIGGASVYETALRHSQTRHVLLTKIRHGFECDTFFPVDLEGEQAKRERWRKCDTQEWESFVGEAAGRGDHLKENVVKEGEVEYEFCLYTRDK